MIKKANILLFLLLSIATYAQNNSDTIDIPEVSITAKKILKNTSLNISKIDSLQLKEAVNADLGTLLSESTPIFVKSEGRGALSTVSFRGTATSHTDVLWNGISLQSPMLGQIDFSLIPAYLSDEINIYAGASSIANTSGALGGSIAINNKADWDNKFSVKFIQAIGSYTTVNDYLQFKLGNKKIQYNTRLLYNYSKNDFKFVNKNIADINPETGEYIYPTQKNNNADYINYSILQELYYRLNSTNIFSVKYWFQNSDRSIPTLNTYEGNDYSNINSQTDKSHRIVADYKHYWNKSTIKYTSAFIYKQLDYFLQNYINGKGYEYAVQSKSSSISFYNKLDYNLKLWKNTNIDFKYSFVHHQAESIELQKQEGYTAKRDEQNLFFMWNQQIFTRLSSTIILRQNFVNNKAIPLIPYIGVEYIINNRQSIIASASVAKNYRTPSLNDLYWQPGGNPDLKPENGLSYELSVKASPKIKNIKINTGLTTFYNNINDWIIWIPSVKGYWEPSNIQKVISKGVECNINFSFKIKKLLVNLGGNYAFTQSLNYGDTMLWGGNSYGKQLPYIPVHSGNIFISLHLKAYFVNYTHNSYSERFTSSSNNVSKRDWLYPYFMNNLSFGKDFMINKMIFSAQFKIYNLFNEEYRSVLGRPMPRQNYLLTLSFKF